MEKYLKKIDYNAPVVLTFFFVSTAALFINFVTYGNANKLFFSVYQGSLADPMAMLRLFLHVLGHNSLAHFSANMMLFLVVGPMLEEKYGSRNFLVMIVVTAVVTGLFNMLFFNTALLGASGVVFMLIVLSSFAKVSRHRIPLTLIIVALIYIGNEVYSGFFVNDNISQLTHILGGILGMGFGFYLNRHPERYEKVGKQPPRPKVESTEATVEYEVMKKPAEEQPEEDESVKNDEQSEHQTEGDQS